MTKILKYSTIAEIEHQVKDINQTKIYTLSNIHELQKDSSIIVRRRVLGRNNKPYYRLENTLTIELSDKSHIFIDEGFIWDLSSVPRFLWWLLPPDGDFELASLIHDFLYIHRRKLGYSRKFADEEMLKWSKAVNGTKNKVSVRNLDNQVRYIAVRLFGWIVWNKRK